jgi:Holliday junction resolvasome RuvABC endonuclease subunit
VEILTLLAVTTKPETKKTKRDLRVSADDSRRLQHLYDELDGVVRMHDLQAVAYEVYTPFRAQGGNAWKCARVEGLLVAVAYTHGLITLPFVPVDLKTGIARNRSASKTEVEAAVNAKVSGFASMIGKIPKNLREHAADATGYALLGLAEVWQLEKLTRRRNVLPTESRIDPARHVGGDPRPGGGSPRRRAVRRIGPA